MTAGRPKESKEILLLKSELRHLRNQVRFLTNKVMYLEERVEKKNNMKITYKHLKHRNFPSNNYFACKGNPKLPRRSIDEL